MTLQLASATNATFHPQRPGLSSGSSSSLEWAAACSTCHGAANSLLQFQRERKTYTCSGRRINYDWPDAAARFR